MRPRLRKHRSLPVITLLLAAATASAASAPATPEPATPSRNQAAARPDVPSSALKAALQQALSRPAPAAEPPADAIRALSFVPDPAITAREQDRIIAHLDRQSPNADPGARARLEQAIRSGSLLRDFDRLLRRYDHSSDNLGDVLAAYLIVTWEVVNDRDSTQVPAGQRAVRRQLIAPLARLPRYASMSDGQMQAQAQRTAYMTMIAATAYQALKRSGDRASLEALQRSVRASVLASGIDLRRLELTDGGLIAH